MAGSREYSVLELDGARLSAITAVVTGSKVEVKRWLTAVRPETVAGDSSKAVGEWIGQEFKRAGLPKGRVVLAVSRGDIVLKQLTLPAGNGVGVKTSDTDIAGMVRLQMVRQLTMSLEGTAIDYAPMLERPAEDGGAARNIIPVLAGAMPADRVAWCRDLAGAAGLTLRRIGLRCFGAAALLAELSQRKDGPLLGVAIGSGSTEFVVVEDGQMVFARAADIPKPTARADIDGFAERVAVEAKRTWMGHKSSRVSPELELVAVLGEGELARRVGERCGEALTRPWETVGTPAIVAMPAHMPESERASAAPLVGLLVESVLGRPTLDFANPRRMPDMAARRRQRVLAAALAAVVLSGVGYVFADRNLGQLKRELTAVQNQEKDLKKSLDDYLLQHARVSHLEQWQAAKVDWVAHVKGLSDELPDPRESQLDELSGRMAATAVYSAGSKPYPHGEWSRKQQAVFEVTGKVEHRQTAIDLRERLLRAGVFRVETVGADMPDRFALGLTTSLAAPQAVGLKGVPESPASKGEAK